MQYDSWNIMFKTDLSVDRINIHGVLFPVMVTNIDDNGDYDSEYYLYAFYVFDVCVYRECC